MGILLKKLNVVKCVDSEEKARKLEEDGFTRVKPSSRTAVSGKAASGKPAPAKGGE